MKNIGTIENLWRYPVKSMRGEQLTEAFAGFSGFYGDRCYAIKDVAARKGFPYLNATVHPEMLLFRPQFRRPDRTKQPPNLREAASIAPGVTPSNPDANDFDLDVVTPTGEIVAVDNPKLLEMLGENLRGRHDLSLVRSDRALTDCRPVSMISLQTIRQIEAELNTPLDKRRFRANIYFNFDSHDGFAEDNLIGCRLRIGGQVEIMILQRDPRCKMISLAPETGEHNPEILRSVAKSHEANAGVYCAVLVEGILKTGDSIELLN